MRIKAVLLDFGDTLVEFERFDYDACLKELHRNLLHDEVALSYEDFKKAYFEVRDRLYRETEDSLEEHSFCLRISETLKRMEEWMEEHEYESVKQMQGSMSQQNVAEPAAFERANYMKMLQSWRPDPTGTLL